MTRPPATPARVPWRRLIVIADDLAGAAEAAAAISCIAPAAVVLDEVRGRAEAAVVSIDTDSRALAPHLAAERVRQAMRSTWAPGTNYINKIDSLLRGNVAVETAAALEQIKTQTGAGIALVAAANPLAGRRVRGGQLIVPENVEEEVGSGDIVGLLEEAGMRTCAVAGPRRDQELPLASRVEQAETEGYDAVVLDGETVGDLLDVAALLDPFQTSRLLVGSGGLCRAIGALFGDAARPRQRAPVGSGPVLIVIGSHSQPAQAQREHLLAHHVRAIAIPADPTDHELADARERLGAAVLQGEATILHLAAGRMSPQVATGSIHTLAELVAEVVDDLGVLALTGGETARAVLTRCGVADLRVVDELEPGVVTLRSTAVAPLLVTKPGSFGAPDLLTRIVESQVYGELI